MFGAGAVSLAGRYARNLGAGKVLVVTDHKVRKLAVTDHVLGSLENAGVNYSLFYEVSPNPTAGEVMAGAAVYKAEGCNMIVAVGGGSPMDCAKGIGIVSANNRPVLDFAGVDNVPLPGPPLICVPTTAGTSADVSQFAIIRDPVEKRKVAIVSKTVVPDVALIDPLTTLTMDPQLTACTGMDALTHAIEAYVSNAHSPLTDLHAYEAIRLLRQSLPQVVARPGDQDIRARVMLGSLEAGLAFSNASLGAVHAMAHSLGGLLDLPHGACNAALLPLVVDYNFASDPERYSRIGIALGLDMAGKGLPERKAAIVNDLIRLQHDVSIRSGLSGMGVRRDDIPVLTARTMEDPCLVTNPRRPSSADIEVIFEHAL
ncbi:MAG: L-1,2-propanediol oxidoreductase [Methanocella sp. PtaU1.Bin125]|nr:MAG: L-1,2-propanediol oxidoreductase [Methanocella sp. PtaU1.Bin125]